MRFRRPDGRPAKLTLGPVDLSDKETSDEPVLGGPLSLRQARQLATSIDRQRARGLDVVEDYKADAATPADRRRGSRRQYLRRLRRASSSPATRPSTANARATGAPTRSRSGLRYPLGSDPATAEPEVIKGGLADTWDAKPVAEIDANDIHVIVTDARKRGIPGLGRRNDGVSETRGRRLHAALSVLFRWLVRQRKITTNPCAEVERPSAPADRERVLSDAEIVTFWHACDRLGPPFGALFKVLLLTGARLREVADMTRGEIGADGVWTIPGSRTKNHRPLSLPLPPLPRQIIDGVPAIAGDAGFVFTTNGKTPVSGFSKTKRKLDAAMAEIAGHAVPEFRLHDLRRTFATGMAELGVALPVIEKLSTTSAAASPGSSPSIRSTSTPPRRPRRWRAGRRTSRASLRRSRTRSSRCARPKAREVAQPPDWKNEDAVADWVLDALYGPPYSPPPDARLPTAEFCQGRSVGYEDRGSASYRGRKPKVLFSCDQWRGDKSRTR